MSENGIRFAGREWLFKGTAEGITVTECAGPMGVPVRNIRIPPEIHISFCKLLKAAAKEAKSAGWSANNTG